MSDLTLLALEADRRLAKKYERMAQICAAMFVRTGSSQWCEYYTDMNAMACKFNRHVQSGLQDLHDLNSL